MKRLLTILVAFVFLFVLTSCKANSIDVSSNTKSGSQAGEVVFFCTALGDYAMNDSGFLGIKALETKGYQTEVIETGTESVKMETSIREACDSKTVSYIVADVFYQQLMEKFAVEYKEKFFILLDCSRTTKIAANNIVYVVYAQHEASYLAGIAAASASKSGVIGAVGGTKNPATYNVLTGYVAGAIAYNPEIQIVVDWLDDQEDDAMMRELCSKQIEKYRVDVIYPVALYAKDGAVDVANANSEKIWCIGHGCDQYALFKNNQDPKAELFLTSTIKKTGNGILSIFSDLEMKISYWGAIRIVGSKEQAVGFADNELFRANTSETVQSLIRDTESRISSGSIKVKSYFDFREGIEDFDEFVLQYTPK